MKEPLTPIRLEMCVCMGGGGLIRPEMSKSGLKEQKLVIWPKSGGDTFPPLDWRT